MRPIVAALTGLLMSFGLFAAGVFLALTAIVGDQQHAPTAGQDVVGLWTVFPTKVDPAAQDLERLPSSQFVPPPALLASAQAEPVVDPVTTASLVDEGAIGGAAGGEVATAHLEWCAARYRSYRPEDNSYTSYAGYQKPCVSPYLSELVASGGRGAVAALARLAEGGTVRSPIAAEDEGVQGGAGGQVVLASADLPILQLTSDSEPAAARFAPEASFAGASDRVLSCSSRYRSYRPEDNSYQPFGGGPRRQCR